MKNPLIKSYPAPGIYYPEHAECDKLLKATNNALDIFCEHGIDSEIIIIINDTVAHFGLGGPQAEAIYAFINHLAAENFHAVDIENSTVTGNL